MNTDWYEEESYWIAEGRAFMFAHPYEGDLLACLVPYTRVRLVTRFWPRKV